MKRSLKAALIAIVMMLAACAGHKNILNATDPDRSTGHDGSSYEKAVIINETHELQGVDAEYAWLKQKHPGYRSQGQALLYHDKKPFDLIHIVTADGNKMDVYFDISKFFGK